VIEPGQVYESRRSFTQEDFDRFAELSGDDNPIHVDPAFAANTHFGGTVSHGMLLYSVLSAALKQHIPGAQQLSHEMMFPTGTHTGEEIVIRLEVLSVDRDQSEALLGVATVRPSGDLGLQGQTRIRLGEGT
jgi:3-hydroxybutyryl-CoA dehydratase